RTAVGRVVCRGPNGFRELGVRRCFDGSSGNATRFGAGTKRSGHTQATAGLNCSFPATRGSDQPQQDSFSTGKGGRKGDCPLVGSLAGATRTLLKLAQPKTALTGVPAEVCQLSRIAGVPSVISAKRENLKAKH